MADERKVQDEVKDTEIKAQELSDQELDQVAGGGKPTNTASSLMTHCATGTHIPEATITH